MNHLAPKHFLTAAHRALRLGVGITHEEWELSMDDYWELYQAHPNPGVDPWEHLCRLAEQVNGKWPWRDIAYRCHERLDAILEEDAAAEVKRWKREHQKNAS